MVELSKQSNGCYALGFAGDTFNTAVYLARCNPFKTVAFHTMIGRDNISNQFIQTAIKENIVTSYIKRSNSKTMGLYLINVDRDGERNFAYWRDNSAIKELELLHNNELASISEVYFSGITLAVMTEKTRKQFLHQIEIFQREGIKVFFDANYRETLWKSSHEAKYWIDLAYHVADVVFPGGDDHRALFAHGSSTEILDYFADKAASEIIIKDGTAPIVVMEGDTIHTIRIEVADNVVDSTAAGDSFVGGYLASRLTGRTSKQSALFAAQVAKIVISHPGAIIDKQIFDDSLKPFTFFKR
jgi:2-dehydro-3-deoxygluconokinase